MSDNDQTKGVSEGATTPPTPVRALRYAGWAFLTALLASVAFVAATMGTTEFLGHTLISGFIFGLCPGVMVGLAAVVAVLVTGGILDLIHCRATIRRNVLRGCVALPVVSGLLLAGILTRPHARLRNVLHSTPPPSVSEIRVAGFSSFLARRWYAQFSISSNDLQQLVQANRLTLSTNNAAFEWLASDGLAGPAKVLPTWKPARVFEWRTNKTSTSWWTMLAVDVSGTNVFFLRSYQN